MGLIGKDGNGNEENDNNTNTTCTVIPSVYREEFHENTYGDIDDLLGINDQVDNYYDYDDDRSSDVLIDKDNINNNDDDNSNENNENNENNNDKNDNNDNGNNEKTNSNDGNLDSGSHSSIDDQEGQIKALSSDEEPPYTSPTSPISPTSPTSPTQKKRVMISTSNISSENPREFNHRTSISNFLAHLKPKNKKKKDDFKSTPELSFDDGSDNNPVSSRQRISRKQRSNTMGSINKNSNKKSILAKRGSYVEIGNHRVDQMSPLAINTNLIVYGSSQTDNANGLSCDIDSVLGLVDEKENIDDNGNSISPISPLSPTKSKNKLESKGSSNSLFFNPIKRKKDRKSMNSLNCISPLDIMQRKKSFVYSSDVFGSTVLPSNNNINSTILSNQNSNSQMLMNEDILLSPKNSSTKKKDKSGAKSYHLPDYSDLLIMSESDIDGIYNNMVSEVNHKKKNNNNDNNNDNNNENSESKESSNNNLSSNNSLENKTKEKGKINNDGPVIVPLKTAEDKEDEESPVSVVPMIQNNKEDPLRKSGKTVNINGSNYEINSPSADEKKVAVDVEDDNIVVVINPYGVRDIDYSTRRVLPVTNKENCSEDVDDLFNLENEDRYQESVNKLNEIESTYNNYKTNSKVKVNNPNSPKDIDDLFIMSSDIEKQMSELESLVVVDDIQENIRPDINDLLKIGDENDKENNNNNNNNNQIPTTGGSMPSSPKELMRRISKNGRINSISSTKGGSKGNGQNDNYKIGKMGPSNLLVIPSYTEINKLLDAERKRSLFSGSYDELRRMPSPRSYGDLNRNKLLSISTSHEESLSKGGNIENRSTERLNIPARKMTSTTTATGVTVTSPMNINPVPLNYVHSLSHSLSNDGLVVIRSNDNVSDDEQCPDYIYYNRDHDRNRARGRKGSVMDDFIELSTISLSRQRKNKITQQESTSISTFKTAHSTVKDFYELQDEEQPLYSIGNIHGVNSLYSVSNAGNNNNAIVNPNSTSSNDLLRRSNSIYQKRRNQLVPSTSISLIRNELFYSDYIQNNPSFSVNNLKSKANLSTTGSVFWECIPEDQDGGDITNNNNNNCNNITPIIVNGSNEKIENNDSQNNNNNEEVTPQILNNVCSSPTVLSLVDGANPNDSNAQDIVNEANKALANGNSSTYGVVNDFKNNSDINYYLNMTNLMNDERRKNQSNVSLEVPQFTTGYSVGSTYISRMRLASSVDIFNRLEALNRSNSVHDHRSSLNIPSSTSKSKLSK